MKGSTSIPVLLLSPILKAFRILSGFFQQPRSMCEEKVVRSCRLHTESKPQIKKADNALKTNIVHLLKKDRGIGVSRRYLIKLRNTGLE